MQDLATLFIVHPDRLLSKRLGLKFALFEDLLLILVTYYVCIGSNLLENAFGEGIVSVHRRSLLWRYTTFVALDCLLVCIFTLR